MKQIDILWKAAKGINKKLDVLEDRVAHIIAPQPAESRETPFIFTEKFVFNPREPNFEISEQTLVASAGVTTKITRLNYSCYLRAQVPNVPGSPPLPIDVGMRPTARGLVAANGVGANNPGVTQNDEQIDIAMFDFEWNLALGSTEREYAKTYGDLFRGFCSRDSLANYDQLDSLVISDEHPLIIGSNQFLIFKVRPTLFNFFFESRLIPEYVLTINAIGYRSLSDV